MDIKKTPYPGRGLRGRLPKEWSEGESDYSIIPDGQKKK
jgi:hypothetical protein